MTAQLKYIVGGVVGLVLIAALFAASPWTASAQSSGATASNALLTCEPSQQVVVRHVAVKGELQLSMQCVGVGTVGMVQDFASPQPIRTSYAPAVAPVAPVRRVASTRTVARQDERLEPQRSWKKTALVIGGSAGAGAGVGAIAGGKKGALIGAAIGGGAASIYEAIKRK